MMKSHFITGIICGIMTFIVLNVAFKTGVLPRRKEMKKNIEDRSEPGSVHVACNSLQLLFYK